MHKLSFQFLLVSCSFFLAFNSASDVLEDVTCVLTEDLPACEVTDENNNIYISISSPPQQSIVEVEAPIVNVTPQIITKSTFSIKDAVSLVLAFIGVSGLILNARIFITQRNNRIKDKEDEKFNFWLKEIIYPSYLSPVLDILVALESDYGEWVNKPESKAVREQKDSFVTKWSEKKVEILNKLPSDFALPYLNGVFQQLRSMILKFDEDLLSSCSSSLLFSIPSDEDDIAEEQMIDTMGGEIQLDSKYLSEVIQFIYQEINKEQSKNN